VAVPEDVGCSNLECIETNNCKRAEIFRKKTAREVKSFGGTATKGCGKFIPLKQKDEK